jgi:hypothetical protein
MNPLKSHILAAIALFCAPTVSAQEFTRELKAFSKIIASPHINLILEEGNGESVRVVHGDFPSHKINIEVRGRTLHLFLDDARMTDKMETISRRYRRSAYRDISITAYVSYRQLNHLQVRGAQEVTCLSPIQNKKNFKLKAYGENEITLSSVKTDYFKATLYGENRVKIKGGNSDYQKYRLYGENKVDAWRMKSYSSSTTTFGESDVRLYSQDEVRLTSFGETRISYAGNASLSKGLIFGKTDIVRN